MELWIRSQDKSTLSKITEISFDNDFIMGKNDNQVYAYLGQYNSKERCLEILDEIQKIMSDMSIFVKSVGELSNEDIERGLSLPVRTVFCNDTVCPLQALVYEMPEE